MKIKTLYISGRFDDAYIYMGWLSLFYENRTLRFVNMDYIAYIIERRYQNTIPAGTYLFARNDWLRSEQFQKLIKNAEVSDGFVNSVNQLPSYISLERKDLEFENEEYLEINDEYLLDIKYYNTKLYIGTSDAVYNYDIDWRDVELLRAPQKRHDGTCLSISCRYGAVNASCGEDGLLCSLDEFDLEGDVQSGFKIISPNSVRSGWTGYNIVNYPDHKTPLIYRTSHEKAQRDMFSESSLITEVSQTPINTIQMLEHIMKKNQLSQDDIQYVFNSDRIVFVHTYRGEFFAARIKESRQGEFVVKFDKSYKGTKSRILSAIAVQHGIVVETDTSVFFYKNEEWYQLIDQPVLSVRTYQGSKRYQNLISVTTEEGVYIFALFDESGFVQKNFAH